MQKSYNTLEECIKSKSYDDFIFKQNHLQKSYSYGLLEIMKKFQKKHKCNLYEYVDYNLPIRLFFYIHLHNTKNSFEAQSRFWNGPKVNVLTNYQN